MLLAKVVGTVVATRKDPRLVSNKLLIARPMDPRGKAEGSYLVAVDTVDAGVGETVLIVSGSSARMASGMKDCPVDDPTCQTVQAPHGDGQRLIPDVITPGTTGVPPSDDAEIRLTYRELSALIEDAIRNLR